MVLPICLGCGRPTAGTMLCLWCDDELEELRLPCHRPASTGLGMEVCGLFRYGGLVRQLVLRVKVSGDHRALRGLLTLAEANAVSTRGIRWADWLIANPSSLWGRLRGRLDLAALLTTRLAAVHGRRQTSAPPALFWRLGKQARRPRARRTDTNLGLLPRPDPAWAARNGIGPGLDNVLLIDDVLTTGRTLRRTAQALVACGLPRPRCFVLAVT